MVDGAVKRIRSRVQPSPVFGDRFPYPIDGKSLLFDFCREFAAEFNQQAQLELVKLYGVDRLDSWIPLTVNSAYPTTRQQCPRLSVLRLSSTPKPAGLGGEIETRQVPLNDQTVTYRIFKGQTVTDQIEVSICSINERLRDDVFIWLQQYCYDAIAWTLPQVPTVADFRCTSAQDDQVEYQGASGQPGFEFYVGRMTFQVVYDLLVIEGVDVLKQIVNWQECLYTD